jgi:hypothetical protein
MQWTLEEKFMEMTIQDLCTNNSSSRLRAVTVLD